MTVPQPAPLSPGSPIFSSPSVTPTEQAERPSAFLSLEDPVVQASAAVVESRLPGDDLTSRLLRSTFRHFGEVAPVTLSAVAAHFFTTPQRIPAPPRERAHIADADHESVRTSVGRLAISRWAAAAFPWESPARATVVLLHGWQGRGSQLCAFVDPLRTAGFDVVAIDGPGHGNSTGNRADVGTFSIALREVVDFLNASGPSVRGVVAHSMGAGAAALAATDGLDVDGLALIAPPQSVATVTDDFARALGLTAKTEHSLKSRLRRRFHPYLWDRVAIDRRVQDLAMDALIVHDVDDMEVPFARGHAVAAAWPRARLVPTQGLGHRRILRDPQVVETIVSFLAPFAGAWH